MVPFELEAACACLAGRESNNEDNFYFDGRCLQAENRGLRHAVVMSKSLQREVCFAVFDGIGEMDFGEAAAFAAAQEMQAVMQRLDNFCIPEKTFLQDTCRSLHEEVLRERNARGTDRMGVFMGALFFSQDYVYMCGVGDVRTYRLRGGEFLQLSKAQGAKEDGEKPETLSRYLGMDTSDKPLKPYIAKGELRGGDKYLICSGGVTSVLTNLEIDDILLRFTDLGSCAQALADKAVSKGSQKNVTAIVIDVRSGSGAAGRY